MRANVTLGAIALVGVALLVLGTVRDYGPLYTAGGIWLGFALGIHLYRRSIKRALAPGRASKMARAGFFGGDYEAEFAEEQARSRRKLDDLTGHYRTPGGCENCGRARVLESGVCEKCEWDNDAHDYAAVTRAAYWSAW